MMVINSRMISEVSMSPAQGSERSEGSYAGTMFVLRSYFDGNRFRKDSRARYEMGGVRHGTAQS